MKITLRFFACTVLFAASALGASAASPYAGTYTGYLCWGGSGYTYSYPETLKITSAGVATLAAPGNSYGLLPSGPGNVSAAGLVNLGDGFTLQIKNFGVNTGAYASPAFLQGWLGYPSDQMVLVNSSAKSTKISATTGSYSLIAMGGLDYGFLTEGVGSGTGKIGTTGKGKSLTSTWSATVTLEHTTVSLSGTVTKAGVFLVNKPSLYKGGVLVIFPYAVGKSYVGFKGYFMDSKSGLFLTLIGVRTG
jgi:hypothetical protein